MRKCLTTAPEQKNKLEQGWRIPILNGEALVKLGDNERIGVKEPFPMTDRQFTS